MLTINRKSKLFDNDTTTAITLHDDGVTVIAYRNVNSVPLRIFTTCDGTTLSFSKKINMLAELDSAMFKELCRIQQESLVTIE